MEESQADNLQALLERIAKALEYSAEELTEIKDGISRLCRSIHDLAETQVPFPAQAQRRRERRDEK